METTISTSDIERNIEKSIYAVFKSVSDRVIPLVVQKVFAGVDLSSRAERWGIDIWFGDGDVRCFWVYRHEVSYDTAAKKIIEWEKNIYDFIFDYATKSLRERAEKAEVLAAKFETELNAARQ